MGFKEFLGFGDNKGVDCEIDENGNKICRVAIKSKNNLLATGTTFSYALDSQCKAHLTGRSTILDEDEEYVRRELKRGEVNCRGGNSIN